MGCCSSGHIEGLPQSIALKRIDDLFNKTRSTCSDIHSVRSDLLTQLEQFTYATSVASVSSSTLVVDVLVLLVALLCKSNGDLRLLGVVVTEYEPFVSFPNTEIDDNLLNALMHFRSLTRNWSICKALLASFFTQRDNLESKVFIEACQNIIERSYARPEVINRTMNRVRTHAKMLQGTLEFLKSLEDLVNQLSLQLSRSIQLFYAHQDILLALAEANSNYSDLTTLKTQCSATLLRLSVLD